MSYDQVFGPFVPRLHVQTVGMEKAHLRCQRSGDQPAVAEFLERPEPVQRHAQPPPLTGTFVFVTIVDDAARNDAREDALQMNVPVAARTSDLLSLEILGFQFKNGPIRQNGPAPPFLQVPFFDVEGDLDVPHGPPFVREDLDPDMKADLHILAVHLIPLGLFEQDDGLVDPSPAIHHDRLFLVGNDRRSGGDLQFGVVLLHRETEERNRAEKKPGNRNRMGASRLNGNRVTPGRCFNSPMGPARPSRVDGWLKTAARTCLPPGRDN